MTVEIRKLQVAKYWAKILQIFKPSTGQKLEGLEPSKAKRRKSQTATDEIQEEGKKLRGMVVPRNLLFKGAEEDGEILVDRYPRAKNTEEMEEARHDASQRILSEVLIPSLRKGGIKGKVGRLENLKDLNFSDLSEGIKAAEDLPLDIGENAQDIIAQAKAVLKFRRAVKNAKGNLDKCYDELVELIEDPNIAKPPPSPAPGDTPERLPPAPPKSPTSPTLNKFAVLQSGRQELKLIIRHVRYMQIVREIPDILRTGAATKKPGETNFDTIDTLSLELTLEKLSGLEEDLDELADLKILARAVNIVKDVRECLESKEWDKCQGSLQKATKDKLVENLPTSCSSAVAKELEHAKKECVHQIVTGRGADALKEGRHTLYASNKENDEVRVDHVKELVAFAKDSDLETNASKQMVKALELALALRETQVTGDRERVKALLAEPDYTKPPFPLKGALAPLKEEIEFANNEVENLEAIETVEGELGLNAITGIPGALKNNMLSEHEPLFSLISKIKRTFLSRSEGKSGSDRTRRVVELASIVSTIRRGLTTSTDFDEVRDFLEQFKANEMSFRETIKPVVFQKIRHEMSLAEKHVRVMFTVDELHHEALENCINVETHLEGGEDYEVKKIVDALDMLKCNVDKMEAILEDGKALLEGNDLESTQGETAVSSLKDKIAPAKFFNLAIEACGLLCKVRRHLKSGNFGGRGGLMIQLLTDIDECVEKFDEKGRVTSTSVSGSPRNSPRQASRSVSRSDQVNKNSRLKLKLLQEKAIAKLEINSHIIVEKLSIAFKSGGVTGKVGNINYEKLEVKNLQKCNQEVAQIQPHTRGTIELSQIAVHLAKIRAALMEKEKFGRANWNVVARELGECGEMYLDHDMVKDEMTLIKAESDDLRVRTAIQKALETGWDKVSGTGELHPTRIESGKLFDAIKSVKAYTIDQSSLSPKALKLIEVAEIMARLRSSLRRCVEIQASIESGDTMDAGKRAEIGEGWEFVKADLGKIEKLAIADEELAKDDENKSLGLQVAEKEIVAITKEFLLYEASVGIVNALVKGVEAHASGSIEEHSSNMEPLIEELETAVKEAKRTTSKVSKLDFLIKNGDHIVTIRKAIFHQKWSDVEDYSTLADTALRENVNEHAKQEIAYSIKEAHNQRVYSRMEACIFGGGASGEIGQLDASYSNIKVLGFKTAFEFAEHEESGLRHGENYKLRPKVAQLLLWSKLVFRLRQAQQVNDKAVITSVVEEMVREKTKNYGRTDGLDSIPYLIKDEFNLAKQDGLYKMLKNSYERAMRHGQAKEGSRMTTFCVITGEQKGEDDHKCQFCSMRSLGNMKRDKLSTKDLEDVCEAIESSEEVMKMKLSPFLRTAQLILKLRKAQMVNPYPDYEVIRGVLTEALGDDVSRDHSEDGRRTPDPYGNSLPEAHKELKLAEMYLKDWEASNKLKEIFNKESGSFYRSKVTQEEAEELEAVRRSSIESGGEGILGRRYSASNIHDADLNVRFEDVDTEEIDHVLFLAQKLAVDARSKETKILLHTVRVLGDLRGAMKTGQWPQVAQIVKNTEEKKMHPLAKEEMKVIKYHLKAREDQKLLLEGMQVGAPTCESGWIDTAMISVELLQKATSACNVSNKKKQMVVSTREGQSAMAIKMQTELNREVDWLIKCCERVINVRKLILNLDYKQALRSAKDALKCYDQEKGQFQAEWSRMIPVEISRYIEELKTKSDFAEVVKKIQVATSKSCNVEDLKRALLVGSKLQIEKSPDLSMRQAILHAKRVLRETTIIETKLEKEGILECDQKSLELGLKRADELKLVTETTKKAKSEMKSLVELRKKMAKAVTRLKVKDLNEVRKEIKLLKDSKSEIVYEKMKNFPAFMHICELPRDINTFLQLELSKFEAIKGDEEGLDNVVNLTMAIKESHFSVKVNQIKYGDLRNFEGLRKLEEFSRHRMITDPDIFESMMESTSEPIPTTLLNLPTNLAALGTRIFRHNMLGIVGVRKFSHPSVLYLQILRVAQKVGGVRDEVFCQIMKMMNGCDEHPGARVNLWALMKLCVKSFPPSKSLENWLEFFLLKNKRRECLKEMHKCIFRFKIRKDLSKQELIEAGAEFWPLELKVGDCDVDAAIKFYESIDFDVDKLRGDQYVNDLEARYHDTEFRKRWMTFSGGRLTLSADELLERLNNNDCGISDFRAIRFLVCGDINAFREKKSIAEFESVGKAVLNPYLQNVHRLVLEKVSGSESDELRK